MGRLAFGYEQNLQFDLAMKTCQKALDHTPRDIWAVHAMAHIYEETQRYSSSGSTLSQNIRVQRVDRLW